MHASIGLYTFIYIRFSSILIVNFLILMLVWVTLFSYVTREELRQALAEYQMGDEATIDEVIDDVDTDNVCYTILYFGLLTSAPQYSLLSI
jgi:hypothetical protein